MRLSELRSSVVLRDAREADLDDLIDLWDWVLRRGDRATQEADLRELLAEAETDPDLRVVVAECDAQVAGVVCLRASHVTPLNRERCVQAISPHVRPEFRGRGVGRALIEVAATFAEERRIGFVATAAAMSARDANRFLARLGLVAEATLRVAPTEKVLAKVAAQLPAPRASSRHLTQVLAARRSRRRREAGPEPV